MGFCACIARGNGFLANLSWLLFQQTFFENTPPPPAALVVLVVWWCHLSCPILTLFLTLTTLPQSNSKLKLVRSLAVCEESFSPPFTTDLPREHQVNSPSSYHPISPVSPSDPNPPFPFPQSPHQPTHNHFFCQTAGVLPDNI